MTSSFEHLVNRLDVRPAMSSRKRIASDILEPEAKRRDAPSPEESVPSAPRFEFEDLVRKDEALSKCMPRDRNGKLLIDFSNRSTTLALTKAILKEHYDLKLSLPEGHLVPTIPNRVQYLQWAVSLLSPSETATKQCVLDVGTGPSCVYAMLGARMYPDWIFMGVDSDTAAVSCAEENVTANNLHNVHVIQVPEDTVFTDEVRTKEPTLTVCNPPFHEEYTESATPAGTARQMATTGGEYSFISRLAEASTRVPTVSWFTSLVGRKADLPRLVSFLRGTRIQAVAVRSAELRPGGRTVRWAVAWTFGAASSKARARFHDASAWRALIELRPGRQYANQLVERDVLDVCEMLLLNAEWRASDEAKPSSEAYVDVIGRRNTSCEDARIRVQVASDKRVGRYDVLLKVLSRGRLKSSHFQTVTENLAQTIETFLDAPPAA